MARVRGPPGEFAEYANSKREKDSSVGVQVCPKVKIVNYIQIQGALGLPGNSSCLVQMVRANSSILELCFGAIKWIWTSF